MQHEACKEVYEGGIILHPYIPGGYQCPRRDHRVGGGGGKRQVHIGNQGNFDTVPYGIRGGCGSGGWEGYRCHEGRRIP